MGWHSELTDRLIDELPSGASLFGRRHTVQSGGTPWPKASHSADGPAAGLCPAYGQRDALASLAPRISPPQRPRCSMRFPTAATDLVPTSASVGASATDHPGPIRGSDTANS